MPVAARARRSTGRVALLATLVLGVAAPAAPRPALAQAPDSAAAGTQPAAGAPATARVTYLAGASVYVDAGERAGLRIGDTLQVLRDGEVVARLRVDFLSSLHASCRTLGGAARIGDRVRFVAGRARARAADVPAAKSVPAPVPSSTPRREGRVRGRLGVRYLASRGRDPAATSFSQPSLDVRLDGRGLRGSTLEFTVDARARRTYRPDTSGADDRVRVYRLSATAQRRDGRARLTVGRQYATALSSVSLFDGGQVETDFGRFGAGAFAGTQPGATDFGYSRAVREAGAYVRLRPPARAARRWSLTLGGITSNEWGEINRDYVLIEGTLATARTSALVTQELDWNRGWRAEGQPAISFTSTYAIVRAQVRPSVALDAGYDNRGSVRLYRDRVTPLTEFDDRHRQGFWAGASATLPRGVRLRVDARASGGGSGGRATSQSASAEAPFPGRPGLALRARATRYAQPGVTGWIEAAGVSAQIGAFGSLEASGGVRTESDALDPALDSRSTWFGLDADVHVARRLYLLLSIESDRGDAGGFDQRYVSASYRF